MNTKFIKTIDDKILIKSRKNISVTTKELVENPETGVLEENYLQIFCPSDETLFADGWELYVIPEPTPEEIFERTKRDKIDEINHYDSSEEVNIFYIQGLPVWLDKATRAGLKLRFEAEIALKHQTTTLWYEGQKFELPLNSAMAMLYALEVYASQCYDNTQYHLSNVDKLETLDEISEYDYRVGYPEKLNF